MPSFSTQASIEARIKASRLNTLTFDKDDAAHKAASIDKGIVFAGAYISGRLKKKYGQTIIDTWILPDDVPPLVGWMSDSLCIWNYAVEKPNLFPAPEVEIIFTTVNDMLTQIIDGELSLDGIDAPVVNESVVERIKSDFDPERDLDNISVRTTWILPDLRELPDYPE
jgi:hypothetical protein